ncbi:MAG: AMP-dependent synthetase/ligase [Bryobacteraceae bacterium]
MDSRTMYTVLAEAAAAFGKKPALHQPLGKGEYRTWSWIEYKQTAEEIACGLARLGIQKGDIIALYSETRAEFYRADLGILSRGAVAAALYTSYPVPDLIQNLRAVQPKLIFAEDAKAMRTLVDGAGDVPFDARWILLTGDANGEDALTLAQLQEEGRRAFAEDPQAFEKIRAEVTDQDYAILYLTSGATGEPKMGLATHHALVANVDTGPVVLPLHPGDSTIAFLPSAHIAQRVVVELVPIRMGASVWFSESLARLPHELKAIKPTFFLAPPRVWERIYSTVSAEVKKRGPATRRLFYWALGLGLEASRRRQEGRPIPGWLRASLKVGDKLVFSKIRERLGGRLRMAASGAAPLGRDLANFFAAIGMPLIEGYGLTEGGVVSFNPLDRPKSGSIGKPLPGVEMKLAEDGELLVRSGALFSGYYNDPAATAAILRDGWLYTGDIAEIDSDGYWYITGRKKELIVASNGKKIYPARIEGLFKLEPVINQVLLIGDRLPYITALFTVNPTHAASPVSEEVRQAVSRANKQLAPFEQIRKFKVLERDFSIEAGELTPTMKVRRSRVLENYRSLVNEMYMGKEESQ